MAPDARNTAAFCHQSNPPAKNARYRTMNENQNTITRIVAAILDPNEAKFVLSSNDEPWNTKSILYPYPKANHAWLNEATNKQHDPHCGENFKVLHVVRCTHMIHSCFIDGTLIYVPLCLRGEEGEWFDEITNQEHRWRPVRCPRRECEKDP